ncbi:non-ribosomal peptide synthetase [Microcystis aeruginosa]|uniref:non-ribosomal peptide synthetase n=2 Tax=Microcystis TaxID=1125 RepID=UPI0029308DC1|nr:non-ribosomal peptide synthetase [Microcystis aeruginosa]WOB66746.1 amino acid adenylation domain-containing protein [Microcystis aeruginosa LE3]
MKVAEFLSYLNSLEIKLWLEEDKLKYQAPQGAMTPEIKQEIGTRKPEILTFLRSAATPSKPLESVINTVARTEDLPLSFAQQRMWFLYQMDQQNSAYNEALTIRLTGRLNIDILEQTINAIIQRHESLRTSFPMVEGKPIQKIAPSLKIKLLVINLKDISQDQIDKQIIEELQKPFDLTQAPLLRCTLFDLGYENYILVNVFHHIIIDGWSKGILFKELSEFYQAFLSNSTVDLPELAIQYADFAVWQRQWLQGEILENQLNYWKKQLTGAPPLLELPTDKPRLATPNFRGHSISFQINSELTEKLKLLSQKSGGTLFMTLLAALNTLLFRYSGQDDILIGTPTANRNRQEIEPLIGFFVNTLVLRNSLEGNPTFSGLLQQARNVVLEAYANQDVPFEQVVDGLEIERSVSYNPLFQVMFALQNAPLNALELPDLKAQYLAVENQRIKFDLSLVLEEIETEKGSYLEGFWEYDSDLFTAERITRMVGHFQTLLKGIVANPQQTIGELPLLTESEKQQLLVEWNQTQTSYPDHYCIHQLFEEQVKRTPEAVAVVYSEQQLTYNELNCRANQLAHYLQSLGVKPEQLVGICLERSLDMIVGLLAILKAGGAYVPLDPEYPTERLLYILQDAQIRVLLTQKHLIAGLPKHQSEIVCLDTDWSFITQAQESNPCCEVQPENLAYAIYTSGSTGKPKGVMIQHSSVVNLAHGLHEAIYAHHQISPLRVSINASLAFDASVQQIIQLIYGHSLNIVPEKVRFDSHAMLSHLRQQKIDVLDCTPSQLRLLISVGLLESDNHPQSVLVGGEAIDESMWATLAKAENINFYNVYGPTECTVDSTICLITANLKPVIGRPIAKVETYILDEYLQPVPVGVPGELHIGGAGLARGYLNHPELTNEKFIPHPFHQETESRLYKTGDLGRYLPDGNIEYLGRIDNQVKIRGFRIELGEIETVLSQHSAVKTAVVIAREDETNQKRLVAYIIPQIEIISPPKEQNSLNITQLRQFLKAKLPEYMIPSAFVILESLPLTPNGKTDYRGLPAAEFQSQEQYIAPRNPIEEILSSIWAKVLKVAQVGIHDNFFELGGHSLLATQLISRIREAFQVEMPLRELFVAPTIAELSQEIKRLSEGEQLTELAILPRDKAAELPLSFAQTRLWFLAEFESNSSFYNIPLALRLEGNLNSEILIQSLEEICDRHEALRTNFITVDGIPTQVIQARNWTVTVVNLQYLSGSEKVIASQELAQNQAIQPFDLAGEPLIRITLVVLSETEHLLLVCMHHIVSDGWSMGVFIQELTALYNAYIQGLSSPLNPLSIQYGDFTLWQRQWLQGEVLENQLNYWKKQLADAPTFLPLPTDKPRPAVQTFTGVHQEFQLSLELTQKLTELSQQQGVTMFMTLLAVYGVLLYRYTGQSDILIGTPIANRNRREIESLIGFFVNTLVMRTDCSENPSFQELLMRVREMSLGAYAHQDLPFEMLVEALQTERNLSHTPLFQVMFVLQNTPLSEIELMGLTIDSLPLEGEIAKFDLTLSMQNTETGLMGVWEYNTDLFNSETIERMNGHFLTLLEGIITNPSERVSQLPLLTKVQQQQLLIDWNNTEVDYPANKCIHQLFEEQVERTPNAVAVTYENESLTYRELNNRANQLAHYLRKLGVKADTLVGISLERSLEMMVGLLGILKAGGAYVPLDPDYPQERLSFMLEDSQVKVLVTQAKLVKSIPEHQAQLICLDTEWEKIAQNITSNPESVAKPENLIYIIYTSGSTGKPKGVLVNHSNVVRLFAATDAWYNFNSQDVWSLFHSYAFDFSVWEMWGALLYGGRLVVVPYLVTRSPEAFYQLLYQEKVTILNQTPTAFRQLIQAEESLKGSFPLSRGDRSSTTDNDLSLRLVIFGGEALEINSLQPWFQRHGDQCPQLVNMYGITETTVHVTYRPLSMNDLDSTASVIGRPIPDLQVYLLDQHLQLVPVGVPGEMYVGGAGVTKGYLNRPELTTERFIPSPFEKDEVIPPTPLNKGGNEPSKLYKTGDLARYLPDGNIEYLGRIDNQVKIRGFRIELGEIEALLASHPQIWETVVIVRDDATGDKRLVAYIVPQSEKTITINEIRQFLKAQLPGYMIPNAFVILDALPLTANGKIDSRALPPPESSSEPSDKYVAPRTPIEDILVTVWSEVLKVEKVGINDNFFELGGHSLLATKLVAQIRDRLKVELPLRQLFNSATLAELAQGIEQLKQEKSDTIIPAILPRKRK